MAKKDVINESYPGEIKIADTGPTIESVRLHEPTQFLNISTAAYSVNDPAQQGLKISFFGNVGILLEFKGIKRVMTFNNVRSFDLK